MNVIMIIVSAALTGLCFTCYKAGFLALFTVIPFFYVILKEANKPHKPIKYYGYGYLFGAVFYACIFYWFKYQYPLEYLNFTKFEAVAYVALTWFGSGLLLSVLFALFPLCVGLFSRTKLCKKYTFLFIPFASCAYVIIEFLFTLGSLATPWARLAITQQSNILGIQTASVFGSYFISFIIISVNAALAYGIYELKNHKNKKVAVICLICSAALFFGNMGVGAILYAADKNKTEELPKYTAAALQGNIVSGRSEIGSYTDVCDYFLDICEKEIGENGTKLIVMPEGSFSIELDKYPKFKQRLIDFCAEYDVVVIFGCYEHDGDDFYNVTYCISPDGTVTGPYRKQHPVPFGEFTPAKDIILAMMPFLKDVTNIGDELSAGKESVVFDSALGKLGAFICFDSAFEGIGYEETAKGATVLTESTNDSWWMDSIQLYQHNGHAILRAVEGRRYVVRSSAAGYSTVISPEGEIISGVQPLTAGFATAEIAPREDLSFYHKTPYLFPALCLSAVLGGFVWAVIYKKRGISKNNDGKVL